MEHEEKHELAGGTLLLTWEGRNNVLIIYNENEPPDEEARKVLEQRFTGLPIDGRALPPRTNPTQEKDCLMQIRNAHFTVNLHAKLDEHIADKIDPKFYIFSEPDAKSLRLRLWLTGLA